MKTPEQQQIEIDSILCRLERLGKVKRMCGAQQKPSWWVLV